MSGWFDSFRHKPFPTLYGPLKSAVTADVLEAGLLFAIAILAFSFLLILPGIILKKRLIFLIKVVFGLFILASIFLCNFGQEWEVSHIHTKTPYKAGVRQEIEANIEVKIGLRSVNITLRAGDDHHVVKFPNVNETINYNERFSWDDFGWAQGRGGFGPFAGLVQRQYREGQLKGLPYPILWIAEYFTPDGEGIRWGRFYRQAGYYCHIMLWTAFPLYVLALILLMMVRSYGGIFFGFTGLSMLTANIIYAFVRNPTQLVLPFEDDTLHFKWGWCFWLCLITGFLNLLISLIILAMDCFVPDMLRDLLDVDVAGEYDQFFISEEELIRLGINVPEGSRPRAKTPGEQKPQESLRYGYRRRTHRVHKLVGTLRGARDTQSGRTPIFLQKFNDQNGEIHKAPVYPSDTKYGYDNRGISLDEIAASTPDPDDMRAMNMHPDMDNYDNMRSIQKHLASERGGRRPSDDPVYSAVAPTTPTHMKHSSIYSTITEDTIKNIGSVHSNGSVNNNANKDDIEDEAAPPLPPCGILGKKRGFTNEDDTNENPPPLPPCGILGKKRGITEGDTSPPLYDNNINLALLGPDMEPYGHGEVNQGMTIYDERELEEQESQQRSPTVVRSEQ